MSILKGLFKRRPKKKKIKKTDIDRRFDRIGRVGQGSMSKVWRARDLMTGRIVALKILDKEKTARFEARFEGLDKPTEGETAVRLRHPHIVLTHEHGLTMQGEQFLVMEFVDGVGLSYLVDAQNQVMRQNRLRFMIQLGSAVAYFHKQDLIHRDLCPRNVLVDSAEQIKLIDFGLTVPNTETFRKPGNRTGTANYMAPELIKRQSTDQRIDIFSFAVTCFEMVTKTFPWEGAESLEMVIQHINTEPRNIREFAPEIDEQVAAAIMKGLERDRDRRWPTMDEMLAELREARRRLEGVDDEDEEDAELEN